MSECNSVECNSIEETYYQKKEIDLKIIKNMIKKG